MVPLRDLRAPERGDEFMRSMVRVWSFPTKANGSMIPLTSMMRPVPGRRGAGGWSSGVPQRPSAARPTRSSMAPKASRRTHGLRKSSDERLRATTPRQDVVMTVTCVVYAGRQERVRKGLREGQPAGSMTRLQRKRRRSDLAAGCHEQMQIQVGAGICHCRLQEQPG